MPDYRTIRTPGGFEMLIRTHTPEERRRLHDPIANARAALFISQRSRSPWKPFRRG